MTLVAVDPGPFTTMQDRGRRGWQRYGVAPSGAMDLPSFTLANALVGNAPEEAMLEFTLVGGSWRCAAESMRVAVTGGAFGLRVDGAAVPAWASFTLRRGQTLTIAAATDAARGYLAVAGGFLAEKELGSVSVHLRSGLGGAPVAAGAALRLRRDAAPDGPELALDPRRVPPRRPSIRVILGPQDDFFSAAAIEQFLAAEWHVTGEADRMGMKLRGPRIPHANGFNIISDGIATGSIQVPGNGQPILLLNDRQTAGGYPKIATAITADRPTLGQLRPGDTLRFVAVTLGEARAALAQLDRDLENALSAIAPARRDNEFEPERLLGLNLVDGVIDARSA